jgi:uncharacterized protein (TIGR00255 family)
MAKSMTAFSRIEDGNFSWEIRSVNQRYLDVSFRMPENYRQLEIQLRNTIRKKLNRGKVDCSLRVTDDQPGTSLAINQDFIKSLAETANEVDKLTGHSSQLHSLELMRWPGAITSDNPDVEGEQARVLSAFNAAIGSLIEMRQREGEELKKIVFTQLDVVAKIVREVREAAPVIAEQQRIRLTERLASLEVEIDQGRLEQEIVYMAQKSDIVEELDRLETHVQEVRNSLEENGPIGRRLDFLMQELNREANTLSSKATTANTSLQSVDLKVVIEQMREQIQNLE